MRVGCPRARTQGHTRLAYTPTQTGDRQRVLDATDVVRLIGEHVTLKPKGREFVCLCPFHDDHKPSMYVVPAKQIYHCFSCGAGGNAIDFVMNYHKMEFVEALRFLADRAGVELAPRRAERGANDDDAPQSSRAQLAQAAQFALEFFRTILRHPTHGETARSVVERRAITAESSDSFALGAAPDRWDGLVRTIESRGLALAPFVEAGLVKRRQEGDGHYDTFRNRLVFPIHDQLGRPIAFGGRKLREEDDPKYLNSPESRLFDKGGTLYGLHHAARAIQNERVAIVTEGYIDVIACHQAGFRNVVATLGTALTPRHAATLRRLCDAVVLLFDSDEAGLRAADRALEVFFAEPIDVRIASLPDAKDPDELFALPDGAERFRRMVTSAADALDHRFARLADRLASVGPSARSRLIEEDMSRLVDLGLNNLPPIRRQYVVRKLARLAGVDERTILAAIPTPRAGQRPVAGAPAAEGERFTARDHALGCLLCDPALRLHLDEHERDIVDAGAYPPGPVRSVADAFRALDRASQDQAPGGEPTLSALLASLDDQEPRRVAARLAAEIDRITDHDTQRLREHLRACLNAAALESARLAESASPGSGGADTVIEQLQRRRLEHERFGGDPRALPRPAGAPAAR